MKKSLKFIALVMSVLLLCGSLVSCSIDMDLDSMKMSIMTDPAKAIYLYRLCAEKADEASSGRIDIERTIDIQHGDIKEKHKYKREIFKSDYNTEAMKFLAKESYQYGETAVTNDNYVYSEAEKYSYGFSEGKMFSSEYDNKMYSDTSFDEYIASYVDSHISLPEFKLNITTCANSSYTEKEDGGYTVELGEFYGEALPVIVDWVAKRMVTNSNSVLINSYTIKADMTADYSPISTSFVIDATIDAETDYSQKVVFNVQKTYFDLDKEVEIPNLTDYTKVSDLRMLDRIENAISAFLSSDEGEIKEKYEDKREEKRAYTNQVETYTQSTNFKYGKTSGKWGYSLDAYIQYEDGSNGKVTETYEDGVKSVNVRGKTSTDKLSEQEAREYFLSTYKMGLFVYDRSLVDSFESTTDTNTGHTTIVFKMYQDDLLAAAWVDDASLGHASFEAFDLTVVLDKDYNIISEKTYIKIVTEKYNFETKIDLTCSYNIG